MPGLSLLNSIDPLEAAVFVFGLLLAMMGVRLIKARQDAKRERTPTRSGASWIPAVLALICLLAVWLYLS